MRRTCIRRNSRANDESFRSWFPLVRLNRSSAHFFAASKFGSHQSPRSRYVNVEWQCRLEESIEIEFPESLRPGHETRTVYLASFFSGDSTIVKLASWVRAAEKEKERMASRRKTWESRVTGDFVCSCEWQCFLRLTISPAHKLLIFLESAAEGRRCASESWLFGTTCRNKSRTVSRLRCSIGCSLSLSLPFSRITLLLSFLRFLHLERQVWIWISEFRAQTVEIGCSWNEFTQLVKRS